MPSGSSSSNSYSDAVVRISEAQADWLCQRIDRLLQDRLEEVAQRLENSLVPPGTNSRNISRGGYFSGDHNRATAVGSRPSVGTFSASIATSGSAAFGGMRKKSVGFTVPEDSAVVGHEPSATGTTAIVPEHSALPKGPKRERAPVGTTWSSEVQRTSSDTTGNLLKNRTPDIVSNISSIATWNCDQEEVTRKALATQVGEQVDSPMPRQRSLTASLYSMGSGKSNWLKRNVVQKTHFEVFWSVLILTNAGFLGLQAHLAALAVNSAKNEWIAWMSSAYNIVFAIECILRLSADGLAYFCAAGCWWNYFDVLIVFSSLVEMGFEAGLVGDSAASDENSGSARVINILRITRLIRIFRIVRIVRFIRSLRTLVYSILATLRSLFWAMVLLVMIIYVFGVMFTQAITDHVVTLGRVDPDGFYGTYWGSLGSSMFTLFASIANGISWGDAVKPLEKAGWLWRLLFIIYICFTFLAVLNVVTGVFCQSAIEGALHDQDMLIQEALKTKTVFSDRIRALFSRIDRDGSGHVTITELENHMNDPAMQAYFQALELDASDAWTLFKLVDSEVNHTIDCEDFILGCLRLKGNAKAIDLAQLTHDLKLLRRKLATFMTVMNDRLEELAHASRVITGGPAEDASPPPAQQPPQLLAL